MQLPRRVVSATSWYARLASFKTDQARRAAGTYSILVPGKSGFHSSIYPAPSTSFTITRVDDPHVIRTILLLGPLNSLTSDQKPRPPALQRQARALRQRRPSLWPRRCQQRCDLPHRRARPGDHHQHGSDGHGHGLWLLRRFGTRAAAGAMNEAHIGERAMRRAVRTPDW